MKHSIVLVALLLSAAAALIAAAEPAEFFNYGAQITWINPTGEGEYAALDKAAGRLAVLDGEFNIKTVLIHEGAGETLFANVNSRPTIFACFQNKVRIFQRISERWQEQDSVTLAENARSLDRRGDGLLAVGAGDGRVSFFDSRGKPSDDAWIGLSKGAVTKVRFAGKRGELLITVAGGLPRVWDIASHQITSVLLHSGNSAVRQVKKVSVESYNIFVAYEDETFSRYSLDGSRQLTLKPDKTITLGKGDTFTDFFVGKEYIFAGTARGRLVTIDKAGFTTISDEQARLEAGGGDASVTAIAVLEDDLTVLPVVAGQSKPAFRPSQAGIVKLRAQYLGEEEHFQECRLKLTPLGDTTALKPVEKIQYFSEAGQESTKFLVTQGRYSATLSDGLTVDNPDLVLIERGKETILNVYIPPKAKPNPPPESEPPPPPLKLGAAIDALEPLFAEATENQIAAVYRDGTAWFLMISGGTPKPLFVDLPGEVSACAGDSRRIALAIGSVVYAYDWKSKPLGAYETGFTEPIRLLALHDQRIAAGAEGIKIFNSGAPAKTAVSLDFRGEPLSLCYSLSGDKIYVSSVNRFVYGFHVDTGKHDAAFNYIPEREAVTALAPLSDRALYAVYANGTGALIDLETRPGNVRRIVEKSPVKAVFRYKDVLYTWSKDNRLASRGAILGEAKNADTVVSAITPKIMGSNKLLRCENGRLAVKSGRSAANTLCVGPGKSWVYLQGTAKYAASSGDLVLNNGRPMTEEEAASGAVAGNLTF